MDIMTKMILNPTNKGQPILNPKAKQIKNRKGLLTKLKKILLAFMDLVQSIMPIVLMDINSKRLMILILMEVTGMERPNKKAMVIIIIITITILVLIISLSNKITATTIIGTIMLAQDTTTIFILTKNPMKDCQILEILVS